MENYAWMFNKPPVPVAPCHSGLWRDLEVPAGWHGVAGGPR